MKNHRTRVQPNPSQSGAKSQAARDKALTAMGSKGKKCHKGKCHNCGKQGHWAHECRSPKKEAKPGDEAPKAKRGHKSETKPIRSANTVTTYNEDADGCWAVDFTLDVPDSEDVTLVDESDWLVEEREEVAATISPAIEDHGEHIELYDSGATHHISLYKSDFATYSVISPPVSSTLPTSKNSPQSGWAALPSK